MGFWTISLLVGALLICQAWSARLKREEPDYKSEDTVEDYAGNENVPDYAGGNDKNDDVAAVNDNDDDTDNIADYVGGLDKEVPKEEPKDTFTDTFNDPYKDINTNVDEDRFGGDRFEDDAPDDKVEEKSVEKESDESKHKKHAKKGKYLKKTLKKVSEFLKKVLDPNKLMENAYVTEMLRRFSDHETKEVESKESEEHHVHPEIPIPKKTRKRRGRPSKKDKIPPGITGLIKKGIMSLTQMEVDKKKLRRRVRLIKRIARKAKKPLKTAVKIFLSSRNQGIGGGYGGAGYNNNY